MGRNRTIPFGYMMKNGTIAINPAETLSVVTIFSEYMSGKSLTDIAKEMNVPYSEGSTWNKNMVKRILENKRYLGTEIYPQLINEDVFKAVNERKTSKATALCKMSSELQEIRNITICKKCGKKLFRSKTSFWDCRNHECHPFLFYLTDELLINSILNIINIVADNITLIEKTDVVSKYIPNSEIFRTQNEINRSIDNESKGTEDIKKRYSSPCRIKIQSLYI